MNVSCRVGRSFIDRTCTARRDVGVSKGAVEGAVEGAVASWGYPDAASERGAGVTSDEEDDG